MLNFLALATVMVFRPELFNESLKEEVQGFEGQIEVDP